VRVLVTGAAGFIGANLCRELMARPGVDEVLGLDNLSTGYADNLDHTGAVLVTGSLLNRELLEDLVDGVDAVVHLAARPSVPRSLEDPVASHHANATGTIYLLEACRRRSVYVVAASSSSVYGSVATLPKHEDLATRPLSPYAASKLAAEAYLLAHGAAFGLPVLALRFFNVYGPLQTAGHAYAAAVPAFIDAALRGEPLLIHGDGQQTRDFTFVGTVVNVLADAVVGRVASPEPVNLAFGTRVPIVELARRVAAAVGEPVKIRHGPSRPGDVRDSQAASERLLQLFPSVTPVGLDEGLEETVGWFRLLRDQTNPVSAQYGTRRMSPLTHQEALVEP
jgi:UDP-glucose 4-epimerase